MKKGTYKIIIIIIASLGLVFAGLTVAALIIYSKEFGRTGGYSDDRFTTYFTWKDIDQVKYPREELFFHSGRNKLQGFVYGGLNNKGLVVISHGLGGSADSYFPLIMYFADRGWRVFAFNNTGVSGSEGRGVRGLTQSLLDLDAALAFIENSDAFKGLPVMLAGHSWGGYAVCAVLNYNHRVNAVVSFAGYNKASEVLDEVGVSAAGNAFYLLYPQLRAIERKLFGKAAKLSAVNGINKAGIPVIIVQSSNDHIIRADTTSIYAHRSKISNPNAEIIYKEGANATGHEFVYCSVRQQEYMSRTNVSRAEDTNFDKALANELDMDLMERIERLFDRAR